MWFEEPGIQNGHQFGLPPAAQTSFQPIQKQLCDFDDCAMVPAKGFTSISLKNALIAQLDDFLQENDQGFSSRPEVVSTALREFFAKYDQQRARRIALRPPRPRARSRAGASKGRRRRP